MAALASHLSSAAWNYSFVVSVTQATTNSGLCEHLSETAQPPVYVCFLAGDDNNPATQIDLEEFLTRTGQVNPGFQVGLKVQTGLPPGVPPENLVPIAELGDDAKNVTLNMLCSSLEVFQNTPAGSGGSWDVWSQPVGAMVLQNIGRCQISGLDPELNTKYFNIFPYKKAQIQDKLQSLSDIPLSLQQLLLDLDSTMIQLPPTIAGMPAGSDAEIMLRKTFTDAYISSMKAAGEPLLALSAQVASTPDHSQLCMTAPGQQMAGLPELVNALVNFVLFILVFVNSRVINGVVKGVVSNLYHIGQAPPDQTLA